MKPQVLFSAALLIGIYPGTCCWFRPPLSADISAFSLPIMGHTEVDLIAFVQGQRPWEWLSLGMVLSATVAVGLFANLVLKVRMSHVAGLFFAVLLGCKLSLLLNHPAIIVELDRQAQLHDAVVGLLALTSDPVVEITSFPRVNGLRKLVEAGSFESAVHYTPNGSVTFLVVALMTLLLVGSGSAPRRLAVAGGWAALGLVLLVAVSWPRLASEWHWHRAVLAEQRGQLESASTHVEQAKEFFPGLVGVPRTWMLEGKIDYQRSQHSAARQYYLARQKARNGELDQALLEIAAIKENREWSLKASPSLMNRWKGDLSTAQAMEDFRKGRLEAADQRWDLAMTFDSSNVFRPLCLAALRSRWQGANPQEVVELVDPVLDQLADRSLKAALHAMIGDCFFAAGEFSTARERYQTSLRVFSLPKTINYRALRGLLGW
ncbi:MAG: hypothetical protein GXP28_11090 [Planctomycetes bacterium]|nr:hypothetical protein [Planctomycetota bacterium]